MKRLKSLLATALRHTWIGRVWRRRQDQSAYGRWMAAGQPPVPPPQLHKREVLRAYAKQFGLRSFVETGTFLGDTVAALEDVFQVIHTIELSPELSRQARQRFAEKPHIHVVEGDAGTRLTEILPSLPGPCLFWLDAHYSAGFTARAGQDTPIKQELSSIAKLRPEGRDVILIDDARCFDGQNGYPTLAELRAQLQSTGYDVVEVEDDIVRARSSRAL